MNTTNQHPDTIRLNKLAAWLEGTHGSVGEPCKGSPGWELGFSAHMGYQIDGQGDTLREAIDSLPN